MFKKVLIANRGEIACRVAAALETMGIASVAVYSEADRGALHARVAGEAVPIGPAEPRASYLAIDAIVGAAVRSGAEAIHPGYGFLAENAGFARAVEAAGLTFIGPAPEQIEAMGDKRAARALAAEAGVPVVPGAEERERQALLAAARRIGYPVMVKAAWGGGGKGMRAVAGEAELGEALDAAGRLAQAAFGDGAVYLERRLDRPRHVEVQILGDGRGEAIHVLERECSLQRRHQKVIEECPAPGLDDAFRTRVCDAAVALAKAVRYRGAGTVEFLVSDGGFHFLEMNTRLQVEHPVTELATGIDLVRAQIEIAATGRLPLAAADVRKVAHAIEARVYAEDAARGFLPQAGRATRVRWPRGPFVRVDAGLESGDIVPVHYDPILAKVAAAGADRDRALAGLAAALDDTIVHGVTTNLPFLRALARAPEVQAGAADTEWIEREFLARFSAMAAAPAPELALAAAAIAARGPAAHGGGTPAEDSVPDPFTTLAGWRLPGSAR